MSENLDRLLALKKEAYTTVDGYLAEDKVKNLHALKFTSEMLEADIEFGGYGILNHPEQARQLLKLDTPERRKRAYYEGSTRQNLIGGILSGTIYHAVIELLQNIANGEEEKELYGERTAREYREREAELRKTIPGAIYYPRF